MQEMFLLGGKKSEKEKLMNETGTVRHSLSDAAAAAQ